MKIIFYPLLISAILFPSSYKIIDESNKPIENVQIYNDITGYITDTDGFFFIDNNNCLDYKVSHIGYQKTLFNPCSSKETILLKRVSIPNPEVNVNSNLNNSKLKNTISNIEIFTSANLKKSNKTQYEDILKSSTNVSYSGVSSRPRYFQIRGIGEYEQYASQGGPSYYVATYIDNFNYSGLGMPTPLFDINQVEVVKGSQSYSFGQNALAGVIKVNTVRPKPLRESIINMEIGSFDKKNIHLIHNQPILKNLNIRFGISKNTDRGFIFNTHIDDYSNKRNELVTKLQLSFIKNLKSGSKINILTSSMHSDVDNNYDRWSYTNFNNMEDFKSHSNFELLPNNESKDALKATSNSIEINYLTKNNLKFTTIACLSNMELKHYYDADWSNPNQWADDHDEISVPYYDFAQQETRERVDRSIELKLTKNIGLHHLTLGAFTKSLEEKDDALGFVFWTNGGWVSFFNSKYSINYQSFYYQHKYSLNKESFITFNIRNDIYDNIYENYLETSSSETFIVDGNNADNLPSSENFLSTRLALKWKNIYTSLSRGHKPGGFNQNPFVDSNYRKYKPEIANTFEIGYRSNNNNLSLDINYFYMNRKNLQIDIADQADPSNPVTFYFYTANISNGYNTGIDLSINYKLNNNINLFLNCGLLKTERDSFSYPSPILDPDPIVEDREQSRAPRYTINTGIESQLTNKLFIYSEVISKDSYYYFSTTNQRAKPYTIVNFNTIYELKNNISLNFSIKNVTDERYAVHAFYFSVSGYEDRKLHESPANPRDYSFSILYSF